MYLWMLLCLLGGLHLCLSDDRQSVQNDVNLDSKSIGEAKGDEDVAEVPKMRIKRQVGWIKPCKHKERMKKFNEKMKKRRKEMKKKMQAGFEKFKKKTDEDMQKVKVAFEDAGTKIKDFFTGSEATLGTDDYEDYDYADYGDEA